MHATLTLVCLASLSTAGQARPLVFEAPLIQVKEDNAQGKEYLFLLYNRVYLGKNYHKPELKADYGNPALDLSRLPTTYYHTRSPLGVVLQKYNWFPGQENTYAADARLPASLLGMGPDALSQITWLWSEPPLAVLGMEVGTVASYVRPAQTSHFTERLPSMRKLSAPDRAEEKVYFHYLQDARQRGAWIQIFAGEPRAQIEKQGGSGFYQVMVIETYKLAVRTLHKDLMTKEGLTMLMGKMRDDGILCFHTSNRYYDLAPIIASTAQELNYACLVAADVGGWPDDSRGDCFSSSWVMVARNQGHLAHLKPPKDYDRKRAAVDYWSPPDRVHKRFIWSDKNEQSLRGVYFSDPDIALLHDEFLHDLSDFFTDRLGISYTHVALITRPIESLLRAWSRSSARWKNRE